MSIRNQLMDRVKSRAVEVDNKIQPSLVQRRKGQITGGAIYHNPKFSMELIKDPKFSMELIKDPKFKAPPRLLGSGKEQDMEEIDLFGSGYDGLELFKVNETKTYIKPKKNKKDKVDEVDEVKQPELKKKVKVKDMTPEEKKEYNRLAKQKQYKKMKEMKEKEGLSGSGLSDFTKLLNPNLYKSPMELSKKKSIFKPEFQEYLKQQKEKKALSGSGSDKAKKLGKMYSNKMMELDPDFKELVGSGLFNKFVEGLKEFSRGAVYPIKAITKIGEVIPLPPPLDIVSKAGKLLDKVDDPVIAKDLGIALNKKGKGTVLSKTLQVAYPNVKGAGRKLNKGASDWINFVKKVALEKGITYPQALKVASKMKNKKLVGGYGTRLVGGMDADPDDSRRVREPPTSTNPEGESERSLESILSERPEIRDLINTYKEEIDNILGNIKEAYMDQDYPAMSEVDKRLHSRTIRDLLSNLILQGQELSEEYDNRQLENYIDNAIHYVSRKTSFIGDMIRTFNSTNSVKRRILEKYGVDPN